MNPVLDSVRPVVEGSRDVSTDLDRLADVASWLADEELPAPPTFFPFRFELSREETIDFVLVRASLNFAYTDFEIRRRWDLVDGGRVYADADGLHFAFHRAFLEGVPVLDGRWLAAVDAGQLREVVRAGTIELQMLDERATILRDVGETLVKRYDGRFHNFVAASAPRLYDDGRGFLESLVREFPRFRDVAEWEGREVRLWKLAQLAAWILEVTLQEQGASASTTSPSDGVCRPHRPGGAAGDGRAALFGRARSRNGPRRADRGRVGAGDRAPRALDQRVLDSPRARERLRPAGLQVIVAQIDARLWLPFHKTHAPHHLTWTIYC